MTAKQSLPMNPALKPIEGLAGEWDTEISEASFFPDPSQKAQMHVSIEWLEGGAFLMMRIPADPPDSVWMIGRDDSMETYSVLYFDSRGVSRIYKMSFANGLWKIWRDSPHFSQRFEGRISDDGNTIVANWEKSLDGKTWEHDFKLTYKRAN